MRTVRGHIVALENPNREKRAAAGWDSCKTSILRLIDALPASTRVSGLRPDEIADPRTALRGELPAKDRTAY
jgi:hypothetical protein